MAYRLPWSRFPSIRASSGRRDSPSMARCMTSIRALRMSISSISAASTRATLQAAACAVIISYSASRFFSVSFLESFRLGMSSSRGRITAAAYTGPISGPAPASSTPQTVSAPSRHAARSYSQSSMSILHSCPAAVFPLFYSGSSNVKRPSLPERNSSSRIFAMRSVSTSPPEIRKPRFFPAASSRR